MRANRVKKMSLWLLLIGVIWFSIRELEPPRPVAADASPDVFSAERAFRYLQEIAKEPHPTGSAGHQRVGDYLIAEINRLGLEPQVQTAEVSKTDGNRNLVTAATVRNILVRVAGTSHTSAILVSAHYDSEPGSYGANDDGVAVAAMLETLRMPQAGPKPKNDLIFLFSDGEELNLLGAEAFWRDHPWARDVSLVLNYESRGSRGPSVIWDAGPGIAEADLPYIFDRLYTGEASRNRSSSGSGLGLAIVKRLVERQRGRIDVQSIPDVRTSFEVRLPRAK